MKTFYQFLGESYVLEGAQGGGPLTDEEIEARGDLSREEKRKLKAKNKAYNRSSSAVDRAKRSFKRGVEAAKGAVEGTRNKADKVKQAVRDFGSKLADTTPRQAVNKTRQAASDAVSNVKDKTSNIKQSVKDTAKNVKQTVKNTASRAADTSPRDVARKTKELVKKGKNVVKDAANKVADVTPRKAVNKVKELASDAKTKVKYGRTIKPNASTSALAKRSSDLAKISKFSKGLKLAGRAAGPLAAAIDVAAEKSKGSGWLRSLAKGATVAAGGLVGGALGSSVGPAGTVVGSTAGATGASKAFDVVAGKNAKERAEDRKKNRQRQAGGALVGTGGKTTFDKKKNTMTTGGKTVKLAKTSVVTDPKTGKKETGHLAYKDGKAVYKRAAKPGEGTSNWLERVGRAVNPNAYKKNDAKLAAEKLKKAQANDAQRAKDLGIKPKK